MQRQELLKALEIVKPGLASREIVEQSTSFAFLNGRVVTYNDEISISHPVKGLGVEGAVSAEELYKLLSKIKRDEITIKTTDNEIRLTAGGAKAGLILQQEIKLPLENVEQQGDWSDLPEGLCDALRLTMFSCSRDVSKPILTCANVREDGYIESSDDWRLTRCKVESMPVSTFLIPAGSVRELVKYDIQQAMAGQGWIHFKTSGDTIFSCRIFEEAFPDITSIMEVKGQEVSFPRAMGEVLERAAIFSKRDHVLEEEAFVTLKDNKVCVKSEGDTGWFEEEINMRYDGSPISFSINPTFLRDIAEKHQTCVISDDRMKFSGDGWEHVVALRVE